MTMTSNGHMQQKPGPDGNLMKGCLWGVALSLPIWAGFILLAVLVL